LSGEKKNSFFIFKPFFFSLSDVGQMRRWSNGDVPSRASVHFSSEFEGEEYPCNSSNVVPINTSIKIHWSQSSESALQGFSFSGELGEKKINYEGEQAFRNSNMQLLASGGPPKPTTRLKRVKASTEP